MKEKREFPAVTSLDNPRVKLASSLTHRKFRERYGLVVVEGERLLRQALAFEAKLQFALVDTTKADASLVFSLDSSGVDVLPATSQVINRVSGTQAPQGVVGVAEAVAEDAVDIESADWLLVIDRVQDPGNLGTILRAAAAVGVDGVLLTSGTVDPKNPKVIRASAGAYFRVPMTTGVAAAPLSDRLRRVGFRLVVADARADCDAFHFDWRGRLALVIGNEGGGPDPCLEATDRVRIPMPGGGESLNAAVAASVLLYEALRRRGFSRQGASP